MPDDIDAILRRATDDLRVLANQRDAAREVERLRKVEAAARRLIVATEAIEQGNLGAVFDASDAANREHQAAWDGLRAVVGSGET